MSTVHRLASSLLELSCLSVSFDLPWTTRFICDHLLALSAACSIAFSMRDVSQLEVSSVGP